MQFSTLQFDDKCQNLLNVSHTFFSKALTVSEIYKFQIFYLQKVDQGHGVQFSKSHHSMTNIKIDKCLSYIFALSLTVSEI